MTKTKSSKPSKGASRTPLSSAKLKVFKKDLLNLQKTLTTKLEVQKEKDLEAITTPVPGDDADIATQTYEKEMLFEISDAEREILKQIEDALRRLEDKTYGLCAKCYKPIPLKRLKVIPYTNYCLSCQSQYEARSFI